MVEGNQDIVCVFNVYTPATSVPITTNVVSSNPVHSKVY